MFRFSGDLGFGYRACGMRVKGYRFWGLRIMHV